MASPPPELQAFAPKPFKVRVPDSALEDLGRRLAAARVAPENVLDAGCDPNGAWAYGTDRKTLQRYVQRWRDGFDWRKQEDALNALPNFTVMHDGLSTHFIHARSSKAGAAIPLLLVHGWPGSVMEFLKAIPLLTAQGFDVVAPSLPGYAWSETKSTRGADVLFVATHLHRLMLKLGYEQYAAQGGDWGGIITSQIARQYPQHCVALHINFCVAFPRDWYTCLKALAGMPFMSREEWQGLKHTLYVMKYEVAYQQLQGTKPQSLAYGLNDSPVGLLAWQLEKFQSWSDCGTGSPEAAGLEIDEILANVCVYWFTESIGSSFRLYYESMGHHPRAKRTSVQKGGYVAVPTGVIMAHDMYRLPRCFARALFNVRHWSTPSRGGHFFAMEQPRTFAEDVTHYFNEVIDFEACKRKPPAPGAGPGFQPGKYLIIGGVLAAAAMRLSRL